METASSAPSRSARIRCSRCSAPVLWNPGEAALACSFCGSTQTVPVAEAQIVEYDIAHALAKPENLGFRLPVRRVRCANCNATVAFDPGLNAGSCAFCGVAAISEVQSEDRGFRPESLLPFTVDRERAVTLFRDWTRALQWAPGDLKKKAELREIVGVYLPFWTFDAQARTTWKARAAFLEEGWVEADGKKYWTEKTRWEDVAGEHVDTYDDLLIAASRGLPDELRQGIEPFDTRALVPWDGRYIAGFGAEEYAIDALAGWTRGQHAIRKLETEACLKLVPGARHKNFSTEMAVSDVTFKHVLLPVWIAAYRYKDKSFRFLVNGQTGKVHGDSPESWVWTALAFVIVAVLLTAAILLFH